MDPHDKQTRSPQPFLFQRVVGPRREVFSSTTVVQILGQLCTELAEHRPEFAKAKFTPHDFRRLLATDLVNSGLPIHIGAALLGHLDLGTTRGYVAVFEEDLVRHYQAHLARRRQLRPDHEYRASSDNEWREFEEHFDKRKVELGNCGRPYGTPCPHERSCLRCPVLQVDPKMLPASTNSKQTSTRAEIERGRRAGSAKSRESTSRSPSSGQKREQTQRHQHTTILLGLPTNPGALEQP